MSDFEFETRLERMFAQPPAVVDPNGFAKRLEQRLEARGRLRNALIGTAGVAGAAVAANQVFGSELIRRLGELQLPTGPVSTDSQGGSLFSADSLTALSGGGEVIWMAAAMLALTVGFLATRFVDAF